MVALYDLASLETTYVSDLINNARDYLHIDEDHFELHIEQNSPNKHAVFTYNGEKHYIFFRNGNGKRSLNFKGRHPSKGHKWLGLYFYELDTFYEWDVAEFHNTVATFARSGKNHEDFIIVCEMNAPRADSKGAWVLDLKEDLQARQIQNERSKAMYPGDQTYARPVLWYCKSTVIDFTPEEYQKFTSQKQKWEIEFAKLTNYETYLWIYGAEVIAGTASVFKNMNKETMFGEFDDFQPDELCVGVDIGRVDATCVSLTGVQYAHGKPLKIQEGLMTWWHSNRWHEFRVNSQLVTTVNRHDERTGVILPLYEECDVITAVRKYVIPAIEYATLLYPNRKISVNFEYAMEGATYRDIVASYFVRNPYVQVNMSWQKPKSDLAVNFFSTAFHLGVMKTKSDDQWKMFTSLVYKEVSESLDDGLEIADKTDQSSQKFFDLWDSSKYQYDAASMQNLLDLMIRLSMNGQL